MAQAQLRSQLPTSARGARLFLPAWLSPDRFQMQHSYTFSVASFGGQTLAMGLYTNSLLWQPSPQLSARLDVGFLHTPFGTGMFQPAFGGRDTYSRVFLQGAELLYRPSERTLLRLSFQQIPAGLGWMWGAPYGYYGYWGYGANWGWQPWIGN
jgi:hypothetical protein